MLAVGSVQYQAQGPMFYLYVEEKHNIAKLNKINK